jgi:hypothetical protein
MPPVRRHMGHRTEGSRHRHHTKVEHRGGKLAISEESAARSATRLEARWCHTVSGDNAELASLLYRFCAVGRTKLVKYVAHMLLHRLERDHKLVSDLTIPLARRYQ